MQRKDKKRDNANTSDMQFDSCSTREWSQIFHRKSRIIRRKTWPQGVRVAIDSALSYQCLTFHNLRTIILILASQAVSGPVAARDITVTDMVFLQEVHINYDHIQPGNPSTGYGTATLIGHRDMGSHQYIPLGLLDAGSVFALFVGHGDHGLWGNEDLSMQVDLTTHALIGRFFSGNPLVGKKYTCAGMAFKGTDVHRFMPTINLNGAPTGDGGWHVTGTIVARNNDLGTNDSIRLYCGVEIPGSGWTGGVKLSPTRMNNKGTGSLVGYGVSGRVTIDTKEQNVTGNSVLVKVDSVANPKARCTASASPAKITLDSLAANNQSGSTIGRAVMTASCNDSAVSASVLPLVGPSWGVLHNGGEELRLHVMAMPEQCTTVHYSVISNVGSPDRRGCNVNMASQNEGMAPDDNVYIGQSTDTATAYSDWISGGIPGCTGVSGLSGHEQKGDELMPVPGYQLLGPTEASPEPGQGAWIISVCHTGGGNGNLRAGWIEPGSYSTSVPFTVVVN